MVQNYTRLQLLIRNRRKQTASEWNNLVKAALEEIDIEIRQATSLPSRNAQLTFEEYQEWARKLGEVKGWNIENAQLTGKEQSD